MLLKCFQCKTQLLARCLPDFAAVSFVAHRVPGIHSTRYTVPGTHVFLYSLWSRLRAGMQLTSHPSVHPATRTQRVLLVWCEVYTQKQEEQQIYPDGSFLFWGSCQLYVYSCVCVRCRTHNWRELNLSPSMHMWRVIVDKGEQRKQRWLMRQPRICILSLHRVRQD